MTWGWTLTKLCSLCTWQSVFGKHQLSAFNVLNVRHILATDLELLCFYRSEFHQCYLFQIYQLFYNFFQSAIISNYFIKKRWQAAQTFSPWFLPDGVPFLSPLWQGWTAITVPWLVQNIKYTKYILDKNCSQTIQQHCRYSGINTIINICRYICMNYT